MKRITALLIVLAALLATFAASETRSAVAAETRASAYTSPVIQCLVRNGLWQARFKIAGKKTGTTLRVTRVAYLLTARGDEKNLNDDSDLEIYSQGEKLWRGDKMSTNPFRKWTVISVEKPFSLSLSKTTWFRFAFDSRGSDEICRVGIKF